MTDQDICLVDLPLPPCSVLSLPAFLVCPVVLSCWSGRGCYWSLFREGPIVALQSVQSDFRHTVKKGTFAI